MSEQRIAELRAVFTNEVIRAIGSLARQQNVCREQGGKAVFVTGMEAAREYIVEHISDALSASPAETELSVGDDDPLARVPPAPCRRCGYNGPGYYQRETHPCVPERPTQSVGTLNSVYPQVTPPADTGRASETSGWRTFWGVIGPRGMPCLFGPHRDDVDVIDDDERIALFQVKEIPAPPPSASSATTEQT